MAGRVAHEKTSDPATPPKKILERAPGMLQSRGQRTSTLQECQSHKAKVNAVVLFLSQFSLLKIVEFFLPFSNAVAKTVGVQIKAIRFKFFEADV